MIRCESVKFLTFQRFGMGMVFLDVNHGDRVDILIKILRIK
mgnify:CR=1 FL=1